MLRKIIKINPDKCVGCGLCVNACHEGAIGLVSGKAVLLRDDYCDGLLNCLPVCPTGAITSEVREASNYNKEVAPKRVKAKDTLPCGCQSTQSKTLERTINHTDKIAATELLQWPVQIKLVPTNAPYFDNADLLIAADCTAYAYGNFHNDFIKDKITIIGCPKLDDGDYTEKLTDIFTHNNINSVTVVRMQVPCCGGIENATKMAIIDSNKAIPLSIVTISTDGKIL